MMKYLLLLFILLPSFLQAAELVDRIVAVVGSEVITLSDLKRVKSSEPKDPLEMLIRDKLMQLEMERTGINISDDELAGAVREVLARNSITLEGLKGELARQGTSFEAYKGQMRQQIQRMKFMGQVIYPRIKIAEEEISRKVGAKATEEERFRVRRELIESRLPQELESYLDEVRQKTYVEIKK